MNTGLRAALQSILVLAAFGCPPVGANEPKARLTAEELRSRMAATQRRIKSVYTVYRSGLDRAGADLGEEYYSYRIMAADAGGDFYLVATHGYSTLPWHADPHQQNAILRGTRFSNVNPVNRTYVELEWPQNSGLPGTATKEFFMTATGIWPFEKRPAPEHLGRGRPYMLKDVAQSTEYSLVRPTLELVDGRWCHVLERPGLDRLWLDADRGCVLQAREYFAPNGHLMQRFEHEGMAELAPGVWLPRWVRNLQYNDQSPLPEHRTVPRLNSFVTLCEVRVNAIPEGVFSYTPERGAVRLGPDHVPISCEAGEVEHLDHMTEWITAYAFKPESGLSYSPFLWVFSGFLATVAGRELLLRWRRPPPSELAISPHSPPSSTPAAPVT